MEGYWLNFRTGDYARVREHAQDLSDAKLLKKIGVDPASMKRDLKGLNPRKDRVKMLTRAMRHDLIRVRRHGHQTTFEFWSSGGSENVLMEIYIFMRK